jgi:intermembrane space import and assembly protein 40
MQECFREHPDVYGAELEGDDEEGEGAGELPGLPEQAEDGEAKPEAIHAKEEPSKPTPSSPESSPTPLEKAPQSEKATQ